eukprot:248307-Pyramimonas_sp.AAC.1
MRDADIHKLSCSTVYTCAHVGLKTQLCTVHCQSAYGNGKHHCARVAPSVPSSLATPEHLMIDYAIAHSSSSAAAVRLWDAVCMCAYISSQTYGLPMGRL